MEKLTNVALSRRWSPVLYLRLVNQLNQLQGSDNNDADPMDILIGILGKHPTLDPLLLEYIAVLSSDTPLTSSIVPYHKWLKRWCENGAQDNWKSRKHYESEAIAYLAKTTETWTLDTTSSEIVKEITVSITGLVEQALAGCLEVKFLLLQLAYGGFLAALFTSDPDCRGQLIEKFYADDSQFIDQLINGSNQSLSATVFSETVPSDLTTAGPGLSGPSFLPSRSIRLVWLDWLVRSATCPSLSILKKHVDVCWPQDRLLVVAYELTITAFDCYAYSASTNYNPGTRSTNPSGPQNKPRKQTNAASGNKNGSSHGTTGTNGTNGASGTNGTNGIAKASTNTRTGKPLYYKKMWSAFILNKLPLLLEELLKNSSDERLDGALARVFTTMDKELAAVADQDQLRAQFGQVCCDLGICDPSVLHTLHVSYIPQPEQIATFDEEKDLAVLVTKMNASGPRDKKVIADLILEQVRSRTSSSHNVAQLCSKLISNEDLTTGLFVNIPLVPFVYGVLYHADLTSTQDGIGSSSVYEDFGIFTIFLHLVVQRYRVSLTTESWTWNLLKSQSNISTSIRDLDDGRQKLLGRWILDLYGGAAGGISDDLLSPTRQVIEILPVLLKQSASAYRSAVIDKDSLEGGLDYFAQPFFAPCLGLVFQILSQGVHRRTHSNTMLEMARILLKLVVDRINEPLYVVAAVGIVPHIHAMLSQIPYLSGNTAPKVGEALRALLLKLSDGWSTDSIQVIGSASDNLSHILDQCSLWQTRPSGIPPVPTVLVNSVKQVIGPIRTRKIVENSAGEIIIAVLVADALDCFVTMSYDRLLDYDCDCDSAKNGTALEFANKIIELSQEAALEYQEIEQEPPLVADVKSTELPNQLEQTSPADVPISSAAAPQIPIDDNEMLDDFGYGLDIDQPMDLAALDSAMDYGWE